MYYLIYEPLYLDTEDFERLNYYICKQVNMGSGGGGGGGSIEGRVQFGFYHSTMSQDSFLKPGDFLPAADVTAARASFKPSLPPTPMS